MHPELFKLPFTDLTVKSYGVMVVLGFLLALLLVKKMSKRVGLNAEELTNAGFYGFLVGIIGARVFHVVHYSDQFDSLMSIFAIWRGGLELLGGVISTIIFLFIYLKVKKMNVFLVLDILAVALMVGIGMGRFGCFLNGCCFGQPTSCSVGVVFPYESIPYYSQAYPDPSRNRTESIIKLPAEFYGYEADGQWRQVPESKKYDYSLKPKHLLTEKEKADVAKGGVHSCAAVHPTQLYSSVTALLNCLILGLFWWNLGSGQTDNAKRKFPAGTTGALMLILYAVVRFGIEHLRGDNPYETAALTVSQLLSIAMFIAGAALFACLCRRKCK